MTRRDHEQRPDHDRVILGARLRKLDLKSNGKTFLRRRGIDAGRLGIYLHRIDAPDPGLDLHDHPWPFVSIMLRGGYVEEWDDTRTASAGAMAAEKVEDPDGFYRDPPLPRGTAPRGYRRAWRRGTVHRMPLTIAHRITSAEPGTVTLIIRGRKSRSWGFYLPTGWVDWREYDYDERRPIAVESRNPEEHRPAGSTVPGAPS